MGYRLNCLDEPVFVAVSKPLLTEFGIHYRLESCGACFYFLCVLPRVLSTLSRLRLFAILFLAASSDFKEARSEDLDLDLDATATLCLLVVWVLVCLWVLCCVCSERCLDKDLDRASFWARLLSGCSPLKELVVEVVWLVVAWLLRSGSAGVEVAVAGVTAESLEKRLG